MLSLFSNRSTDHEASGKDCVRAMFIQCVCWLVSRRNKAPRKRQIHSSLVEILIVIMLNLKTDWLILTIVNE